MAPILSVFVTADPFACEAGVGVALDLVILFSGCGYAIALLFSFCFLSGEVAVREDRDADGATVADASASTCLRFLMCELIDAALLGGEEEVVVAA